MSGRGLCDGLISLPEESSRVWCVWPQSPDKEQVLAHWGLLRREGKKSLLRSWHLLTQSRHYSVRKTKTCCSMIVHPSDTKGSISLLHPFWTRRTMLTVLPSTHNRLTKPYVHNLHESPLVYPSALAKRDTHHCTFRKPFALRTSVLRATCKACKEQDIWF